MNKVDLLITNVEVFNSVFKKFIRANVAILGDKIYSIDKTMKIKFEGLKTIDGTGKFLIPGLIDIHMHIESSMTTPDIITEEVKKFGITTLVAEPHEIANVGGISAIEEFINTKNNCSIDVFYGVPSSVPSTSKELETTGAILNLKEMIELSKNPSVICVGEVMNYRGVISDDSLEVVKFLDYVKANRKDLVIEGHCPKLKGLDLDKFLYLGIDGDHTYHTLEEVKEQYEKGMFVELQEKTLKRDIITFIKENNLFENTALVTDDIMPDYFLDKGHLNHILLKAIKNGFSVEEAIYCSTLTPAKRMRLFDRGTIASGKLADVILIDNLETLKVNTTIKDGKIIYTKDNNKKKFKKKTTYSDELLNSIKLKKLTREDFKIKGIEDGQVLCRTIEVIDGKTFTNSVEKMMNIENGYFDLNNSDCLLVAVFERYGKYNSIGFGLVTGDIIKTGAVATTYAHDSHNLLIVGKNIEDMILAGNKVISTQGGITAVKDNKILSNVVLNIGGIVSNISMRELGENIKKIKNSFTELGYNHQNSIMSLSTLTLPVSPELKITDKGLIDVHKGEIVPLIIKYID